MRCLRDSVLSFAFARHRCAARGLATLRHHRGLLGCSVPWHRGARVCDALRSRRDDTKRFDEQCHCVTRPRSAMPSRRYAALYHAVTVPRRALPLLCPVSNPAAMVLELKQPFPEFNLLGYMPYTPRAPKQKFSCARCDKPFEVLAYVARKKPCRFCSTECYHADKKGRYITVPCTQCGKEFESANWQRRRTKIGVFCSHKCYGRWRSANLKGAACPWYKGRPGIKRYEGGWKRARQAAKERDNYTCRDCGVQHPPKSRKLDVHHIVPYRRFKIPENANRLDNLLTLCRPCHNGRTHKKT